MSFKKNEMLIMPAVDIKNGKCVQLVQGKPGSEMIEIDNPENVARHWEELGAETIHIIDLDGTIEGKTNLKVIKKILNEITIPASSMKLPSTIKIILSDILLHLFSSLSLSIIIA